MKNKVFSRLTYTWWIYVLTTILVVVFWMWIFNWLAQPAENEKLTISLVGSGMNYQKMQSDLEEELPDITEQNIKELSVESVVYDSSYMLTNALWARSLDSDIIIVSHSAMFEGIGSGYFKPIDKEKARSVFGDVEFFTDADGKSYGILLYDGQTPNKFSQYYSGSDKCWLFFTANGVNTGGFNGNGSAEDDAALKAALWLFN